MAKKTIEDGANHEACAAVRRHLALSIRAQREGFRRAGLAFGLQARVIALAELTDEQVAALKAESMLVVEEVDLDASTGVA